MYENTRCISSSLIQINIWLVVDCYKNLAERPMENNMNSRVVSSFLSAFVGLLLIASVPTLAAGVDAGAAKSLAKKSGCLGCHSETKTKTGPSYKSIAAKFKGDAGAEKKLMTFITTGPKINVGGSESEHPIVKSKDEKELKNLVDWVLSH